MMLRRFLPALALVSAAAFAQETPAPGSTALADADLEWTRRAEGAPGPKAQAGPIDAAIAECRKALAEKPDSLEARWRLMRAFYFKGEYTTSNSEEQKKIFDDGKKVGEEALALVRKEAGAAAKKPMTSASPVEIAPVLKGRADVLACFYWAAVDWGKWALVFGKTAAVKQGAAAKIRDYAAAVIAMDSAFEGGGGYRVLGRLHHQTPAIPFFTGWASRDEALKNLRLAVKASPTDFINRLYLAEAMWDYEKAKRPEARKMLEALTAETPSPDLLVEDRKTQEEARALLAKWRTS